MSKIGISMVLGLIGLLAVRECIADEKPKPASRQYMIKVQLLEGDPQGSVEEGKVKRLAAPTVLTRDGAEFRFQIGGEVLVPGTGAKETAFFGVELTGKAVAKGEDKLHLDIKMSRTERGESTDDALELRTHTLRIVRTVAIGSSLTIDQKTVGANPKTWMVIHIEEAKPER